eukprot:12589197-Alexandrium_andersonii.AAC.1
MRTVRRRRFGGHCSPWVRTARLRRVRLAGGLEHAAPVRPRSPTLDMNKLYNLDVYDAAGTELHPLEGEGGDEQPSAVDESR